MTGRCRSTDFNTSEKRSNMTPQAKPRNRITSINKEFSLNQSQHTPSGINQDETSTRAHRQRKISEFQFASPIFLMIGSLFSQSVEIPVRSIKRRIECHWPHNRMSATPSRSSNFDFGVLGSALLVPVSSVIFGSCKRKDTLLRGHIRGLIFVQLKIGIKSLLNQARFHIVKLLHETE